MKNILISGASGGIGSQIAYTLANKDVRLILLYNTNSSQVEKIKKDLSTICEVVIYKCNLTIQKELDSVISDILLKYKQIDCLVNCAGISKFQQIQDTTEADFYNIMDTNLKSVVMLTAKVSKNMISNQSGKIVNISSMWGNVGASMESLYSASKGAINSLTLSLAKELGPSNITVNAVCPGLIDTPMNKCLDRQSLQEVVDSTPINRIGTPNDVANLVEFLLNDKANFITGQIISVDGGFSL